MGTKVVVKFRIKPRRAKAPATGKSKSSTENLLITMRVTYGGLRMEFSTGFSIDAGKWDAKEGRSIGKDESDNKINDGLMQIVSHVHYTVDYFRVKEIEPTQRQFKETFQNFRDGTFTPPRQQRFKPVNNYLNFWDVYQEYIISNSKRKQWTLSTKKKYVTIRHNLIGFRDWKRSFGLPHFDLTFDYLDESGLQSFVDYLSDILKYRNSTINKNMVMLKVVMRWAYHKHYHNNTVFETVKTNMKSAPKKVVFFNMKELKQLEEYEIPKQNSHLEKTRDVFLFMCYTGLRYSDVANLKRCDIQENRIEIVTEKTNVVLSIDLNSHSRRVLQKYERYRFKKDAALPMISNQKMNQNLHELCKLAGFNQPIRIINYQGCQRIDEIKPKYEVIGTHTGRRSFICNAISMGIPPQVVMKWTGHSDYKAMKPYIDVCDEIKAEAMKKFDDP